jgi:glycogen synthase
VLRWGGFLDTVVEGVTGVFFDEPRPDDIAKALDRLEFETFDPENIRRAMERWSESRFSRALHFAIQDALARRRSPFRDNHR